MEMSEWLDNLIATHGSGLSGEEEEEENMPVTIPNPLKLNSSKENIQLLHVNFEKAISENIPKVEEKPDDLYVDEAKKDKENSKIQFSGKGTKEMASFANSANAMKKKQENAYCSVLVQTTKALEKTILFTSRPIQAIGELGKISIEIKAKFNTIQQKIMAIEPICQVKSFQ